MPKKVERWESKDGSVFGTEEEAEKHDVMFIRLSTISEVADILEDAADIDPRSDFCDDCDGFVGFDKLEDHAYSDAARGLVDQPELLLKIVTLCNLTNSTHPAP